MPRSTGTAQCKRLPNTATKEELKAQHREKMMGKHFRNLEKGRGFYERQVAEGRHARPNVSDKVLLARINKAKASRNLKEGSF